MRFQILHDTHYTYSEPVHALAMEARLQPCNDDYQFCQRYRLIMSPKASMEEYNTFSDLRVQYWTLLKASEVHIVSESVVDVRERPLIAIEAPPPNPDPIEFYPYLHETPLTETTPAILHFARQFESVAAEDWYHTALTVREAIHAALDFKTGQTTTETTADEALNLGCGVCQDFTHVMLATMRQLGIPARYASGYLNQTVSPEAAPAPRGMYQEMRDGVMRQSLGGETNSDEALMEQISRRPLRGTGASHAWCEVYFGEQHGWRGFDAANNLLVDQNFIRIGAGRDFRDITPIKGVHKGPAKETLKVTVNVTKLP